MLLYFYNSLNFSVLILDLSFFLSYFMDLVYQGLFHHIYYYNTQKF